MKENRPFAVWEKSRPKLSCRRDRYCFFGGMYFILLKNNTCFFYKGREEIFFMK